MRDFEITGFSGLNCPQAQDERCIGPMGAVDVDRSGGECEGTVYVTFADFPGGGDVDDTDVWVTSTRDLGASWGTPVRLNQSGTSNVLQMHPFVAVDQVIGDVVAAWYDARNDPNNRSLDVYLGLSRNCGATFSNSKITAASAEFNNAAISYSNLSGADGFSGNLALENADWQAPAAASAVCTLPAVTTNGEWTECAFNAAGRSAIQRTGRTQVRLRFTVGDNDNGTSDYVSFFSGENADPANLPVLVVTY